MNMKLVYKGSNMCSYFLGNFELEWKRVSKVWKKSINVKGTNLFNGARVEVKEIEGRDFIEKTP